MVVVVIGLPDYISANGRINLDRENHVRGVGHQDIYFPHCKTLPGSIGERTSQKPKRPKAAKAASDAEVEAKELYKQDKQDDEDPRTRDRTS